MNTTPRHWSLTPRLRLICLFGVLSVAGLARIVVSPSGGLSPDSYHYLESAQYLSLGQGYLTTFGGHTAYNVTWPIGYPLGIAVLHSLSGLSVFWCSKLLNYLVWLSCFVASWRLMGSRAWFVVLPLCTGNAVKLLSYTWSECLFLGILLLFCWHLSRYRSAVQLRYWIALWGLTVSLFLVRYVGGIVLVALGLWAIGAWLRNDRNTALKILTTSTLALAFMLAYLLHNDWQTGYWFGERSLAPLALHDYAYKLSWGLLNEWLIVKDWNGLLSDGLCGLGIVLQGWVCWQVGKGGLGPLRWRTMPRLAQVMLGVAGCYLLLLLVPSLTPYMDFNYRFFAPATVLIQIALQCWLVQPSAQAVYERSQVPITILYLSSLVEAGLSGRVNWAQTLELIHEKIF